MSVSHPPLGRCQQPLRQNRQTREIAQSDDDDGRARVDAGRVQASRVQIRRIQESRPVKLEGSAGREGECLRGRASVWKEGSLQTGRRAEVPSEAFSSIASFLSILLPPGSRFWPNGFPIRSLLSFESESLLSADFRSFHSAGVGPPARGVSKRFRHFANFIGAESTFFFTHFRHEGQQIREDGVVFNAFV